MIANCPSCGTHYKHHTPVLPLRARCGRCDQTLDLTRFRPYKIVSLAPPTQGDAERAASYAPIGLDHPSLATTIAKNVAEPRPVPPTVLAPPAPPAPPAAVAMPDVWDYDDPLPLIPEVETKGAFGAPPRAAAEGGDPEDVFGAPIAEQPAGEPEARGETSATENGSAVLALWMAAASVAGTGLSWTLGGTTLEGLLPGALAGSAAWWAWRRWISPR